MKTLSTCLALFLYVLCINGQTQTINCESEIKKLSSTYENYNKTLEEKKQEIDEIYETKKSITQESLDKLSTLIKERKAYIDSLNLTYAKFTSYKNVCTNIPADSIKKWFPYNKPLKMEEVKETEKKEKKKKDCETQIKKLDTIFKGFEKIKKEKEKEIDKVKKVITEESLTELDRLRKERNKYINLLINIYSDFEANKRICPSITPEEKKEWFNHDEPSMEEMITTEEAQKPATYSYFNEDLIISEDVNGEENTSREKKIFNQALKRTNEKSYLGDIVIPQKDEEFSFYNNSFTRLTLDKFKFKKIELEIKDGNFADIQVLVEYKGSLIVFENHKAISFYKFSDLAKRNYLFYSQKQPNKNINEDLFKDFRIRISDVLMYKYKIGNNYIPHKLILELPKEDLNGKETNKESQALYKIKEDTYLDKIVEFRTYSDFFTLFQNANNGLVQIEGSAKFYIFPFPWQFSKVGQAQFESFKSITPYIHFSKFEDENKYVNISNDSIQTSLDLVEKRYLTMGANINLLEIYHKKYPMKANFFGIVNYNLSQSQDENQITNNLRSLGYGIGLHLSSKRFNNFGFDYKISIQEFDYRNHNNLDNVILDFKVPVMKNEAEVFYHPNKNPNQAIFVRLITFNHLGGESNASFYQFQFGYKFSIGSRTVKK
ncbi:hypothetical protein [Tenacibaculum discolor]|uniref:Uncharacterized protein n=1 Tax=Tenacibaculum discolor TaxID=361581 RepID=A0ABT9F5Y4_9FLAO|nr:hypothetical protein [Tenacibaculum discolor]MDP2542133.1 hypothetical protein [Tenacibaculum discolor]